MIFAVVFSGVVKAAIVVGCSNPVSTGACRSNCGCQCNGAVLECFGNGETCPDGTLNICEGTFLGPFNEVYYIKFHSRVLPLRYY